MKIINMNNYKRRSNDMKTKAKNLVNELFDNPAKNYTIEQAENLAKRVLSACEFCNINGAIPIVKISNCYDFSCLKAGNIPNDISGNIFVGGNTESIYNTDKIIIVGSDEEYEHQRFIIAHELAHYFIDYIGSPESQDSNLLFSRTYPKKNHSLNQDEVRADRFAAELLMPSDLFLKIYVKAMEIYDCNRKHVISYLSTFFKTKRSSIERRIDEVIS